MSGWIWHPQDESEGRLIKGMRTYQSEWLRRAGGGRVRRSTSEPAGVERVSWLKRHRRKPAAETILVCQRCFKRVTRRSPRQRYCPECRRSLNRIRARESMRQRRNAGNRDGDGPLKTLDDLAMVGGSIGLEPE